MPDPQPDATPTPTVDPEPESPADRRARGQFLTGRAARAPRPRNTSPGALAWRRLKKNRLAVLGGWLLLVLYSIAFLAPFLAPYGYATQLSEASHPPMPLRWAGGPVVYGHRREAVPGKVVYREDGRDPRPLRFFVKGEPYKLLGIIPADVHFFGVEGGKRVYLLGTDEARRCYLSRLLYGAQISLSVGLVGIAITFTLGLLIGGVSGFYGGVADNLIMRVCEIFMSVPDFYLLLTLASVLPPTLNPAISYLLIIAILSFVGWAGMARVIRGMVLSVREREYVEAARALGVSDFRIIVRHVLPSTFTYAIVAATLAIPAYILGEASLSFLGLGIREPMPSWGNMLASAQNLVALEERPWVLVPGLAIFLTVLAFNCLGDGLRDALDPKSK